MQRKKWAFVAVKLLIVLAVVWGVHRTLRAGLAELQHSQVQLDVSWILLSGFFYVLSMFPAGLFWRRVMISMGEQPPVWPTLRAYCVGHLGKYVPGKALVVILRAGLLRAYGVDTPVAAVSVFFETLTMMAVGASIGAMVLALWSPQHPIYILAAIGFVFAAGLPTFPPLLRELLRWTAAGRKYPQTSAKITRVGFLTLGGGWLAMTICWLLQGCSLWATVCAIRYLGPPAPTELVLYTGCIALAVVAGFASFIPGGLLVRDLVLSAVLAPQLGHNGEAMAITAAVVLRLVWLVADLGISGILYFAAGQRLPAVDREETLADTASH